MMKAKTIFKKAGTVVLCILMFLSLALSVASAIVNSTLKDSSELVIDTVDSEYTDILYDSVCSKLQRKMALVVIKPEDISDIITKDVVIDAAPISTASVLNRLFGKEDKPWEYKSEELYTRIGELLEAYAAEMEIEYEDGSVDQVYELICKTVSDEVNVIPQSYISKVSPLFVKLGKICSLWYIPVIVYVICTAAVILLGKRNIKNAVYNAVIPSFFATFTIYAASAILYSKDYLAKTIIKNEAFQHFLRQVYNSVLLNLKTTAIALSTLFVLMGIVVIIAMIVESVRHGKRP